MTLPTTPLKFPLQGKPLDASGNWNKAWYQALQQLFSRVGADSAPSNETLASAIGTGSVTGPSSSINNDLVQFSGTTGLVIKDSGVQLTSLATNAGVAANYAPLVSPSITGTANVVNVTFSGLALTAASTTSKAGLNLPQGTAPTSPNNGDIWTTATGLYAQINGTTVTVGAPTPGFVAPTLINSWVNYGAGFNPAGYFKDGLGIVHLRGLIKTGTMGAAAFVLPTGFRPVNSEVIPVNSNSAYGAVVIDSSGNVTPTIGVNTAFGLDGVTFRGI